jgi:hypothetical protein
MYKAKKEFMIGTEKFVSGSEIKDELVTKRMIELDLVEDVKTEKLVEDVKTEKPKRAKKTKKVKPLVEDEIVVQDELLIDDSSQVEISSKTTGKIAKFFGKK